MNRKFGISYNTTGAFWCSVILYFFFIFFIFFKLSRYEESIKYTNDKDAFMDVFVVESDISQNIKAPEQNEQKIEEFISKKQIEPPLELKQETTNKDIVSQEQDKPSVNLSDLFSEAAPIDITPQTTQAVQSNAKSEPKSNSKSAADIIASLQKDIDKKAPKSSMTGVYNKYMGDIVEIIQNRWVRYKADTNNNAKVKIIIDKFGKLSYHIDEYSLNSAFNSKVREFLEQLKAIDFPVPPNKDVTVLDINLIDLIETE